MRGIVVVVAFVIAMVLIVGLMVSTSPSLFSAQTIGTNPEGAASSTPTQILVWNSTINQTITYASGEDHTLTVNGWRIKIQVMPDTLAIETIDEWWIFQWNINYFKWYYDGVVVSSEYEIFGELQEYIDWTTINNEYLANPSHSLIYTLKNSATKMNMVLSFNFTKYANPKDAWMGDGIDFTFNQDIADRNTSINAVAFIAELFTFSLPGIDPFLNVLIMLPIYAGLAYLAFIFVLRIIGAVFGGGGA